MAGNNNSNGSKKSLAIMALPICMALGLCFGSMIGTVAGNISLGICSGIIGGSAIGLLIFGIVCFILSQKEKEQDK